MLIIDAVRIGLLLTDAAVQLLASLPRRLPCQAAAWADHHNIDIVKRTHDRPNPALSQMLQLVWGSKQ